MVKEKLIINFIYGVSGREVIGKNEANYAFMTLLLCPYTEIGTGWTVNLTPLHSERPKLYIILAFLSVIGLKRNYFHLWS